MADKTLKKVIKKKVKSHYVICAEGKCKKKMGFFQNLYKKIKGHFMKYFLIIGSLFIISGCGMMPDVEKIVNDIEDTAIVVEINRDAIKQDTDVKISVDVINKDPPKVVQKDA